jgi:hypothetical protein
VELTTGIPTEAITTDITIAASTIGTGGGLSPSTGAPGIIAIGKQYYPVFAIGYRLAGIFCSYVQASVGRRCDTGIGLRRTLRERKLEGNHYEIRNAEEKLASGICASQYIELAAATINGAAD